MYTAHPRVNIACSMYMCLIVLCTVVCHADTPKLAVKSFAAQGISDHEAATLSEVLRTELMHLDTFSVMERSQMDEILREQAFQQSGACNEKECLVQMGQMLGIEQIVAGTIGKVGHAYSITARIISVESGEILHSVSHHYTGPIEDLLTQEMRVVAKKLAGKRPLLKERKPQNRSGALLFTGIGIGTLTVAGGLTYLLMNASDSDGDQNTEVELQW